MNLPEDQAGAMGTLRAGWRAAFTRRFWGAALGTVLVEGLTLAAVVGMTVWSPAGQQARPGAHLTVVDLAPAAPVPSASGHPAGVPYARPVSLAQPEPAARVAPIVAALAPTAPAAASPSGSVLPAPVPAPVPGHAAPAATPANSAYTSLLWRHIAAHRPVGLDLAGKVVVAFTLDQRGRVSSAQVAQSSGMVLLDRAALRALRDASPCPPPPVGLEDAGLRFAIEVDFE